MATVNPAEGSGNPFFDGWLQGWSRKIEISKSLANVQAAIAESARLFERRQKGDANPIELFPRCVVALAMGEKLSVDDMTILLGQSPALIRAGLAEGLRQDMPAFTGKLQHA